VYNFAHDLPGGVRCGFKLRPGLVTQAGTLVTGQTLFTFTTGGPSILTAIPIQDSTDEGFRGLVSVRTALAGSLEYPRSAALGLVGAEDFVQQLRRLGLDGANESGDYYRPSLALGSIDASLWELLHAYRTRANGGLWTPLRLTPGEAAIQSGRRVYSEATTFLLSHILSDRGSRSVTFGLESPLATRFWSAVKTGTSQEMRDNRCIGYTSYSTVGVWVGNLSGEPLRHVSGVIGAAPSGATSWPGCTAPLQAYPWLHPPG
jgi:penicillin-binding protein 1C